MCDTFQHKLSIGTPQFSLKVSLQKSFFFPVLAECTTSNIKCHKKLQGMVMVLFVFEIYPGYLNNLQTNKQSFIPI